MIARDRTTAHDRTRSKARRLVAAGVGALLLAGGPCAAQDTKVKSYRIGVLSPSVVSMELTRRDTLPELARHGFVEGRNLTVDFGPAALAELPARMRDLLAAKPDAIVAIGGDALATAQAATRAVPIVSFGPDPVAMGFAQSLARPGGNVTGIVILATELDGKRLQLLHEMVPAARRFAALMRPAWANREASEREMRAVAGTLGITLRIFEAEGVATYPAAFAAMRAADIEALAVVADPILYRDTAEIVAEARSARLPTMCQWAEMAAAGCLLSYGPSLAASRRRVGEYTAQILKGAKPADLPVEQPTRFELVLNMKAAKALGVAIPPSILARADEVIE